MSLLSGEVSYMLKNTVFERVQQPSFPNGLEFQTLFSFGSEKNVVHD